MTVAPTSPAARRLALLEELADVRAAIARAEAQQRQRLAERYIGDPVAWATEKMSMFVWSKQREIMHSIVDNRRTAVRSCHGVGKSQIAAAIATWWLDVHPAGEAFVVTSAPTYAQVRAILWRYIRQLHKRGQLLGRVNQTEWLVDNEIVAFGRKPADHDESAFQGIHAKYVLVILDEACGIPAQLWIAADALTTNVGCRILAIGNPDNPGTFFREVCDPLSPSGRLWHQISISAFDSPNFTGEEIPEKLAELLISREWADEKREEWGDDNPIYVSKVLGQFPSQNPNAVVRFEDVQACRSAGGETPRSKEELLPVELGVDVGGGGDLSVMRERRGIVAGREWENHSDRPEDLAPWVVQAILDTGATAVKIDSIGLGWGLIGELRNRQKRLEFPAGVSIVAVNGAEKANDPVRFVNRRAEIWWTIGRQMSAQQVWDLGAREKGFMMGKPLVDDRCIAELIEPRWTTDAAGRTVIESKDEIRKRTGGRSPDHAEALLYAFYTPGGGISPQDFLAAYRKRKLSGAG